MSQSVPPLPDALVSEPVVLINAFTVPIEESDRFLVRWKDNARVMAEQPGLVRARLFRSLVDDVELRFVNVAEWESGTALDQARANPEWRASMRRVIDDPELHVVARPVVYQSVVDVGPGDRF
ncbi:antibiotic biosynthesis monooxygenase family protein [Amycolatopsis sp. H20-H5]|uniref:antibiotic biosynthesis monooxygenase family protein n=1 Tax=Amycolatopsis sp. H20-H5 TaxID=3046309 RepID=UPI002DB6D0DD|nr:antibiotic biosynthesis monooxygenase family protein [Amycolatopsis sp. H20-H5]MEC3980498.1 antibiotic biosynthesis monooxygenase family protein [Amycolatopsis sp. H20-H5]